MKKYFLTAFSHSGEHLLNEVIEAGDDNEAVSKGKTRLEEESLMNHPSRIVSSAGGMIHFHP